MVRQSFITIGVALIGYALGSLVHPTVGMLAAGAILIWSGDLIGG